MKVHRRNFTQVNGDGSDVSGSSDNQWTWPGVIVAVSFFGMIAFVVWVCAGTWERM